MAQRKPYNPNTAYGRRKLREEFQKKYNEMSPQERDKLENTSGFYAFLVFLFFAILGLVIVGLAGKLKI